MDGPEVYALYLVAAIGGIVMGAANDLIVLFLGLETLSLAFYVLAASNRRKAGSSESGLKYFVLGGFSSAFFLYGIALVYGAIGSTNISTMVGTLTGTIPIERNDTLVLAGVALLLVGLGFKIAAVPFHLWTPDVYQGAPTPVTAFMASVGKVAAFAALLRVFVVALPFYRDDWRPVIWVLAVLSLVVGSFLAVVQTDVKRMLAYSSISHAGFMLVGVEAAGHRAGEVDSGLGVPSSLVYLLTYAVLVVGTFAVVTLVARTRRRRHHLDAFRGLGRQRPLLAFALTIFLVAQAGVPFTSGFIAKFGVITAGVDEHSYALAIIAMVASVIAAFVYLRIMVSTWMADPVEGRPAVPVTFATGLAITAAVAFTLVVGIFPEWLAANAARRDDRSPPASPAGSPPVASGLRAPVRCLGHRSTMAAPARAAADEGRRHRAAGRSRPSSSSSPRLNEDGAPLGRLRPRRRRGGDGRRARRLVRRHRAVPPPARHPDPAHGDHPQPQGPDRPQPRRVRRRATS